MKHLRIVVSRYGGPDALQVPDIMAREGVHPETPMIPFTPGWDLVGTVDRPGDGVSGIQPGQMVAAMPISGAYARNVNWSRCHRAWTPPRPSAWC